MIILFVYPCGGETQPCMVSILGQSHIHGGCVWVTSMDVWLFPNMDTFTLQENQSSLPDKLTGTIVCHRPVFGGGHISHHSWLGIDLSWGI